MTIDYESYAEDKWGNVWERDAVPGGVEIAYVMLEIRKEHGWAETWGDCQGLYICPRVRVWLDGYQDRDYVECFLLRVWTDSEKDDEGNTVTLTDHLAVYVESGSPTVEWRQDPRLFFDADADWRTSGLHWWVDWCDEERASLSEAREKAPLSPEAQASTIAYNQTIVQRDRDRAIRLGLTLPYLAK